MVSSKRSIIITLSKQRSIISSHQILNQQLRVYAMHYTSVPLLDLWPLCLLYEVSRRAGPKSSNVGSERLEIEGFEIRALRSKAISFRRAILILSVAVFPLLAVVFSVTSFELHCFFCSYTCSACSTKKLGTDIWLLDAIVVGLPREEITQNCCRRTVSGGKRSCWKR